LKVREVFQNLSPQKICVKDNMAYIQFREAVDVEAVGFKYENSQVRELENAPITVLPSNFEMPENLEEENNKGRVK
jgi:hypothetical protein